MSNGSQTVWTYAEQSAYDTVAGSGETWYRQRFNGGGPSRSTSTEEDPEVGGAAGSTTSEAAAAGDFNVSLWYGMLDDHIEALFGGTWTADVLAPGNALRWFTFEEEQPDLLAGDTFTQFVNGAPTALSLTLPTGDRRITGTLGYSFSNGANSATAARGATPLQTLNTAPVMRTGNLVTNLQFDGASMASLGVRVSQMVLNITRQTEDEPEVNVDGRGGITYGDLTAELSISAYDDNRTIFNSLFANTSRNITFNVRDTGGQGYDFLLTGASPNGGELSSPAKNTKRSQTLPYTTQNIQITRVP